MYSMHDRVRWPDAKEGSWASPGVGEIVSFDPERPYFDGLPGTKDRPPRGPAVEVKIDGPKAWRVWLSPDEIMPEL